MDKRLDKIKQILGIVDFPPESADDILWTKDYGYGDNFWLQFVANGKSYALFLQGEEYCANVDFTLILCESIIDECPSGVERIIHKFDHHDTTKAKTWAEEWLLNFLKSQ